jgi:hypothetical protein
MGQSSGFGIIQLVPLLILYIPYLIGVVWLAPKIGQNRWLWLVLMLIPGVNFVAVTIFMFLVAGAILDRLKEMQTVIAGK